MRIYFAGPLFTEAEREWNESAAAILERLGHEVFLPQRDASQVNESVRGLLDSEIVLANLNGPMADDGTCFEVGVGWAKRKDIIAYRDDWRSAGDDGRGNLMLTQCVDCLLPSFADAVAYIEERYSQRMEIPPR